MQSVRAQANQQSCIRVTIADVDRKRIYSRRPPFARESTNTGKTVPSAKCDSHQSIVALACLAMPASRVDRVACSAVANREPRTTATRDLKYAQDETVTAPGLSCTPLESLPLETFRMLRLHKQRRHRGMNTEGHAKSNSWFSLWNQAGQLDTS